MELVVRDLGGHLDFTWGLERVLSQGGSRRLRMGLLRLVRCPWGSGLFWAWYEVSVCLLGYMLSSRRMFLLPSSELFVLLL